MAERDRLLADFNKRLDALENARAKLAPLKAAVLDAKARLQEFDDKPQPDLQPGDAIAQGQVIDVSMKTDT